MTGTFFGILIYVAAQLAVGVWVARRVRTADDFFVAGRRLSPLIVSISVFATWFGAETCVSSAGAAYENGISSHSVEPFAYSACILLAGLLFAAPLWRRGITTIADLLRERFGAGVERIAALLLVPSSLLWAAAQVHAFGLVLDAASDFDFPVCLAIGAGITIVYTSLGGLLADVITDVVQGAALVLGLGVLLVAVVMEVGGPEQAWTIALAERSHGPVASSSWLDVLERWSIPILGSVLAQELISRCLAARSANAARVGALSGGMLYLLVGMVPFSLGLLGAHLAPDLENSEAVVQELALARLTPFFYVLFAGAIVSAILSTVDSTLLACSALLSRNLVLSGSSESASPRMRLALARGSTALFGFIAWGLAWRAENVHDLVEEASGFGSAGVLVAVVFALYTRIGSTLAAYAALFGGLGVWLLTRHVLTGCPTPFLASLAAALGGYLLGTAIGRNRTEQ